MGEMRAALKRRRKLPDRDVRMRNVSRPLSNEEFLFVGRFRCGNLSGHAWPARSRASGALTRGATERATRRAHEVSVVNYRSSRPKGGTLIAAWSLARAGRFRVSGFVLSPGITPAVISALSIELPLVLGLGYVFFRTRGLELGIAVNAVLLAVIKGYTDYTDLPDMLVAVGALAAGVAVAWGTVAPPGIPSRAEAMVLSAVGTYAVLLGTIKIVTDPYDPFDTFLGAMAVVAGALLLRWASSRRHRSAAS